MVLKGDKGVGKDMVAAVHRAHRRPAALSHHRAARAPDGKFNAHLSSTLLLHVPESFWAGDRKAEGVLNFNITSPRVPIERKGINPFEVNSFLRIFMSTNATWAVHGEL